MAALGVAVIAGAGLAGCGSTSATSRVVARIGHLEIVHPYLPEPASPSVAAIYLTVRNTGPTTDRLVSAASPAAASSMLMTEDDNGSTGTMAPLADLVIPAHGTASLLPGHDHLMLESPDAVRVGQEVEVTLDFDPAGSVQVEVPVVPLSAIVDNDGAAPVTTPGTMKGMEMGSTRPAS